MGTRTVRLASHGAPKATEAEIQRGIVKFLRTIGCAVYVTSQGYRKEPGGTRMTPGLPDLLVIDGPTSWTFAEVKASKGQMRPSQMDFARLAGEADIPCRLWRSVEDAAAWAVEVGIVRTDGHPE